MTTPMKITKSERTEEGPSTGDIEPKHMDIICNPAYHAFKAGLEAFHASPTNEILGHLHTILLIDGSQRHAKIQMLIPELYPYIARSELYDALCLLLSDISHLNLPISGSLVEFGIFEKLNYTREASFGLVLSICDCNPAAWQSFVSCQPDEKTMGHPKIQLLVQQYK